MITTELLRLRLLEKRHDRARFDCGVEEMNSYLREQARQDTEKGLSRTFVLTEAPQETQRHGFYTLAFTMLAFEEILQEKRLSRYPAPVALLAQMAVDRRAQGQGLGDLLLLDALARAELASQQIGLYAVVLDAREESLLSFYARYGFERAEGASQPRRMYQKMSDIRLLGLTPAPVEPE